MMRENTKVVEQFVDGWATDYEIREVDGETIVVDVDSRKHSYRIDYERLDDWKLVSEESVGEMPWMRYVFERAT
ncbi:hypothetical protein SAMN04487947_4211 [Halogeometricum rufum]|uniref:Uncharacterized protein n=1 Tax=Halogeometricum rufum TaxID=553469 RepID=A0A1I6JAC8_9EURY|nr:hypothetical protein [Halogeometricum rufum]SFR75888.1 hypothetical protein SAMN04487947_4211 [Halogeometricum rufum]